MAQNDDPATIERYRGAICEDDGDSLLYIEHMMGRAFRECKVPIRLDAYAKPDQLYRAIERGARYDVLFLDIDMPQLNGIDLTRNARKLGVQSAVVFISNKEEMVFQTFEVQPLYFLRKSHFLDGLPHLVRAVAQELHSHERTMVTIEELHSSHVYSFDIQQLIYVEAMGQTVPIRHAAGENAHSMPAHRTGGAAEAVRIRAMPPQLHGQLPLHLLPVKGQSHAGYP